eukprot:gene7046-8194_t
MNLEDSNSTDVFENPLFTSNYAYYCDEEDDLEAEDMTALGAGDAGEKHLRDSVDSLVKDTKTVQEEPLDYLPDNAHVKNTIERISNGFTFFMDIISSLHTALEDGQMAHRIGIFNGCESEIQYQQIKHVVDDDTFAKYEDFTFSTFMVGNPNYKWCPKPGCGNAVYGEPENPRSRCSNPSCNYEHCFNCAEDNHFYLINPLGCPGMDYKSKHSMGKRIALKTSVGVGMVVGGALVAGLAIPSFIIGITIYGGYRTIRHIKNNRAMKKKKAFRQQILRGIANGEDHGRPPMPSARRIPIVTSSSSTKWADEKERRYDILS